MNIRIYECTNDDDDNNDDALNCFQHFLEPIKIWQFDVKFYN